MVQADVFKVDIEKCKELVSQTVRERNKMEYCLYCK